MNEVDAATTAERFNSYRLIRDEIAHEDNLMGSRLSWFAALQSFLLTALVIAQGGRNGLPSPGSNALFPLVPLVALGSTLLILCGVVAGIRTLIRWRQSLEEAPALYGSFPRVVKDRPMVLLGWAAPAGLPLIFLAAWTYLLMAGFRVAP